MFIILGDVKEPTHHLQSVVLWVCSVVIHSSVRYHGLRGQRLGDISNSRLLWYLRVNKVYVWYVLHSAVQWIWHSPGSFVCSCFLLFSSVVYFCKSIVCFSLICIHLNARSWQRDNEQVLQVCVFWCRWSDWGDSCKLNSPKQLDRPT